MSIGLITVQEGKSGPIVFMWIDGKKVGQVELTTIATANLISDLAKNMQKDVSYGKS